MKMKLFKFITLAAMVLLLQTTGIAQETEKNNPKLPNVNVKTLDGKVFNVSELSNNGNPIIVSFWATWCKPCVKEMTTISDVYEDWQAETGVLFVAISVDDARTSGNVKAMVNGKGWEYMVLLDNNQDLKRAMNVNLIPHTFIIDGKGEVVWQHTAFTEGSELKLIELVRKLKSGESIKE
jgi:thiol-disulfide isomerase/thioredoxin